jgi:hypothetical protein
MKTYSVQGLSASGTGPQTAFNIIGSTAIRPLLKKVTIGFRTNPNTTDQQVRVCIGNTTVVGTAGSSPTPKPDDPQDAAAVCTAAITHSGEPTYGSTFFVDADLNQRASKDFVWEDGYQPAGALTASNGIGGKMVLVSNALVMSAPVSWRE